MTDYTTNYTITLHTGPTPPPLNQHVFLTITNTPQANHTTTTLTHLTRQTIEDTQQLIQQFTLLKNHYHPNPKPHPLPALWLTATPGKPHPNHTTLFAIQPTKGILTETDYTPQQQETIAYACQQIITAYQTNLTQQTKQQH